MITLHVEIGHACGHNLIAIVGIGAALALAQALVQLDVPGRVKLLGTPGEGQRTDTRCLMRLTVTLCDA